MERTANEITKERSLRQMKLVALSFLIGAAIIYAVTTVVLVRGGPQWLEWIQAAAEAGMVGGLADWFAVTALFRHPIGLPIPHTAIIPNRKDGLADGLAQFVGDHFLEPDAVRERLRRVEIPRRLGGWLADESNALRVGHDASAAINGAITAMRDEMVRPILEDAVLNRAAETPVAPVLGRLLDEVLTDGAHHNMVDVLAREGHIWLLANQHQVVDLIAARAPEWTPKWVDELVSIRLHTEIAQVVSDISRDRSHEARVALDDFLARLAKDLRTDVAVMGRIEQAKRNLLNREEIRHTFADVVSAGRRLVVEMLDDENSVLRQQINKSLIEFGHTLQNDPAVADKVEELLGNALEYLVVRHSHEVTALITETIGSWDGEEAARRIELHTGRDLQFIRINGTLVGALFGVLIHAASLVLGH